MVIQLAQGWEVFQDVHDLGEKLQVFQDKLDFSSVDMQFSQWKPIDRLVHLQLLFAGQPYFGRELRYFNAAPWWYRYSIHLGPEEPTGHAALVFEGVDYYCRVWLNGQYVGEHEGYQTGFSFEVGPFLRTGDNTIIVKVWSPWDTAIKPGGEAFRTFTVCRDMIKGTYEHDDTLIQRDVNPVGIFRPVSLRIHSGVALRGAPHILAQAPDDNGNAVITASVTLHSADDTPVVLDAAICHRESGSVLWKSSQPAMLTRGETSVCMEAVIPDPELWYPWDQGSQGLYTFSVAAIRNGTKADTAETVFGIRTVELARTREETAYFLNGRRFFIRGTCYFPDVYVSAMHYARYRRDLELIKRAGFNAIRVHVHAPLTDLYDLCDEMGIAVFQDFEINWEHTNSEEYIERSVCLCREIVTKYRNHPSLFTWFCTNEVAGGIEGYALTKGPARQLYDMIRQTDPKTPAIKASGGWMTADDPESGDTHNYTGSLWNRGAYIDISQSCEKLNTEFGFDAPGCFDNLVKEKQIYSVISKLGQDGLAQIQHYQYRLLKYYIEHYRIHKFKPCSGYFQFMFIDLCPQSFYGIYDWWGMPKEAIRAFEESNQPVCLIMGRHNTGLSIKVINDRLNPLPDCTLQWAVTDAAGNTLLQGSRCIQVGAGAVADAVSMEFSFDEHIDYDVSMTLKDSAGYVVARNRYRDAFHHPSQPEGHSGRMSHELGMRLYWIDGGVAP